MSDKHLKTRLQLITDPSNFETLRYVADLLISNWQKPSVIGATEWETVKNAVVREERAKALNLFLEELERMAHE